MEIRAAVEATKAVAEAISHSVVVQLVGEVDDDHANISCHHTLNSESYWLIGSIEIEFAPPESIRVHGPKASGKR